MTDTLAGGAVYLERVAPVGMVLQGVHDLYKAQALQDLRLHGMMSEIV